MKKVSLGKRDYNVCMRDWLLSNIGGLDTYWRYSHTDKSIVFNNDEDATLFVFTHKDVPSYRPTAIADDWYD